MTQASKGAQSCWLNNGGSCASTKKGQRVSEPCAVSLNRPNTARNFRSMARAQVGTGTGALKHVLLNKGGGVTYNQNPELWT